MEKYPFGINNNTGHFVNQLLDSFQQIIDELDDGLVLVVVKGVDYGQRIALCLFVDEEEVTLEPDDFIHLGEYFEFRSHLQLSVTENFIP